jgi:serine/threonine-protein kinase HipA
MGRRAHTQALSLWMNGTHVGQWRVHPQAGDLLDYAPEWQASAQGRSLSLSLPFLPGGVGHRGDKVRAYFDNLLPDSRDIRERLARRHNVGSIDPFRLLAEVGQDCVGALQLLPNGEVPDGAPSIQAKPLTDSDVARLLRATTTPAVLGQDIDGQQDFRISIAGAQEKTALLRHQGQWCLPMGQTPTTHIFKLPLGLIGGMKLDLRASVENEWLCSLILRAYGLPVASCEPLQFEDIKVLAVERFDRAWHSSPEGGARLLRLPQEDLCQATGVPPDAKYEADGGPGIDRIMDILAGSVDRDGDRRTFFQAQLVFWMLCATDGHAKNFSLFLQPGGRYRLTPLYDVLSVYPILGEGAGKLSPFDAKMAMAVRSKNAHRRMREILRRHWVAMGTRHGVVSADGRRVDAVMDDLVARTPKVIAEVRALLPNDFPAQLADTVLDGLKQAAAKLGED